MDYFRISFTSEYYS